MRLQPEMSRVHRDGKLHSCCPTLDHRDLDLTTTFFQALATTFWKPLILHIHHEIRAVTHFHETPGGPASRQQKSRSKKMVTKRAATSAVGLVSTLSHLSTCRCDAHLTLLLTL